jgi:putative hemolysin
MNIVVLELSIILLLILVNGLLAMSEIAVVTSRKARLQRMAADGSQKAGAALDLANAPDSFLSTVQIGITSIGVLAGAFGGATIAEELETLLSAFPTLAPYGGAIGVGVVVVIVTYLSLVWGELVPKRIGLAHPERIASAVAPLMHTAARLSAPLVRLLNASTSATLRLLGVGPSTEPPVTEDEIKLLLEQGTRAGVFEEAELELLLRIFKLTDRTVDLLMTPSTDIVWLDVNEPADEIRRKITGSGHSRFPVCEDGPDHVLGVVAVRDLLSRTLEGKSMDLRAVTQPSRYGPRSARAANLLEEFKTSHTQFTLVVNEQGSVVGAVTLHDIMEAIVGQMPSRERPPATMVVQRDDGSLLIDGMLPFDDFKELMHLAEVPLEEGTMFKTLGGFIMATLHRIPAEGDRLESAGLRLEVVDMDGRRVDKVLVTVLPVADGQPASGGPAEAHEENI